MIPADLCMQTASLICITAQRFSTPLRINCVSIRHAVITRATENISFFCTDILGFFLVKQSKCYLEKCAPSKENKC